MGWPGPWELIVILLIVVMLFGAKRIPEIMGGVGKGIKTFKKAMDGEDVSAASSGEGSEGAAKETKSEPQKSETTKT
ncbi:MAG: twin-arginine translocase TatA/TatE family subunit [Deltaproteobacteria bacterium]|nr:twin-arginine translocase TatA/TatE family subunit [Deltaproteobacteria bacterium]